MLVRIGRQVQSVVAGQTLADLTGGFGVDSFAFASEFKVYHVERDESLSRLVARNVRLGMEGKLQVIHANGIQ